MWFDCYFDFYNIFIFRFLSHNLKWFGLFNFTYIFFFIVYGLSEHEQKFHLRVSTYAIITYFVVSLLLSIRHKFTKTKSWFDEELTFVSCYLSLTFTYHISAILRCSQLFWSANYLGEKKKLLYEIVDSQLSSCLCVWMYVFGVIMHTWHKIDYIKLFNFMENFICFVSLF